METLLDYLDAAVNDAPERIAFSFEGRRTNFAAFRDNAKRIGASLRAASIAPGERIAYLGKNSDRYFEALYGAMMAGAVMVPINWRLAAPEMAAIIQDAEARLMLVGSEFFHVVAGFLNDVPDVKTVLAADGGHPDWPDLAAWAYEEPSTEKLHIPADPDIAVQLYTSGTTGRPKGVMLSHRNFVSSIRANNATDLTWNKWSPGDSALLAMPVSHVSGTAWGIAANAYGATCHIQRQFDVEQTLDMIENEKVTRIFLVPAALQVLVRHPRAATTDFTSIQYMGYGASPIPLPLLRECMQVIGCKFVQYYGMTETTGTVVALPPEDHVAAGLPRMRAAGKPLPWVELRVVDEAGNDLPPGSVGQIVTRSDSNMEGYWKRPEETSQTIRDGWLQTGDAGYVDTDGYVFIHDRVKDMIISGGENVYPAEVENVLCGHPAIAEVAVIGVPDARWGEAVMAIVVSRPGASLSEGELIEWSRAHVAGFKTPKHVAFAAALPRNASGKILKRELRAPFWEGQSRQIN